MKYVLFYSSQCDMSRRLLSEINRSHPKWKEQIIFLSIDKKIRDPITKNIMIVLENGEHIQMPTQVKTTPCLLIKEKCYNYIEGEVIFSFLRDEEKRWREKNKLLEIANLHSLRAISDDTQENSAIWKSMNEPSSYDGAYSSLTQSSMYSSYK